MDIEGCKKKNRPKRAVAESKAHREWTKANTSFIGLKLNNRQDADILQALDGKAKQTEIKRLLRLAIRIEQNEK